MHKTIAICAALAAASSWACGAAPIVLSDFEAKTYGDWKTTGTAFGPGPVQGPLKKQRPFDGFAGLAVATSFHGGDDAIGTLSSPSFKIERHFINFLIGAGGSPETCLNLKVEGKIVRTATGKANDENLHAQPWDVSEFIGKEAILEVADNSTAGHINVDQIEQRDQSAEPLENKSRRITIEKRYLRLPIDNNGVKRRLQIVVGGKGEPGCSLQLANGDAPDWWAWMNVSAWQGKEITLSVDQLPAYSTALSAIEQADTIERPANLYKESLRPQFHFSAQRGWLNDPNGLVYYRGEYHLFYQHNPYGWTARNMQWGHAVSRDLVHWEELDTAIQPDARGWIWSGSAVIDWDNTSGLGKDGQPPMVLFYTAAGNPFTQCLVYSLDGRTFTKYDGNPIVPQITPGNRDPKVIWYEPTKSWVMTLYVSEPVPTSPNGGQRNTIYFLTSHNLKDWAVSSSIEGFFECPDLFELPVDGKAKKWVLTAASGDYMVGTFDGKTFTPETPKLRAANRSALYAGQTFSDIPKEDGRRIRIGWLRADSPGMPFNQAMSLPLELNLVTTPEGPRMTWTPIRELEALRGKPTKFDDLTLKPGDANPLAGIKGDTVEIRARFRIGDAKKLTFNVRGATVVYNAAGEELIINGVPNKAPLRNGIQEFTLYLDRTSLEVFADNGLIYSPQAFIAEADNTKLEVSADGDAATLETLTVYPLRSAWK